MPIQQHHSALARAERYLLDALDASDAHDSDTIHDKMRLALGALSFGGNSQDRLIKACQGAISYHTLPAEMEAQLHEAIAHASGPGVD